MPPTEVRRAKIHLLLHATAYGTTRACRTMKDTIGANCVVRVEFEKKKKSLSLLDEFDKSCTTTV